MPRVLSFVLVALLAAGCSASSDNPTTSGTKDSGKDTGASGWDSSTTDDSSTGTDTSVTPTDTGSPSETAPPTDGTTPTCAKPDTHPGDECDMVKQDCADVTATCEYDPTKMHNACVKRPTGSATKGEACASSSDCDKGLFCYSKHCAPACCTGDNSVCGTGGSCDIAVTDPTSMAVIYHVCSYASKCDPFKYNCPTGEVCLFSEEPDAFKCSAPSSPGGLGVAPGVACTYQNDCGESQACFSLTSGGDAGSGNKCYLFCWLTTPAGFMPGTMPGGRFAANGTCTVGGKSYGTCTAIMGIGGGLGVCVK